MRTSLGRKPRPGEFIVRDEVTGDAIWSSESTVDFWGRVVHVDTEEQPVPDEYKKLDIREEQPRWGSVYQAPALNRSAYFVIMSDGAVIGVFQSDNYSVGQYTEATTAQVNAYLPVVSNSIFSIREQDMNYGYLVGTMSATDPSGYGNLWSITDGNDQLLFTINSTTGAVYMMDVPLSITEDEAYTLTIRATTIAPGNLYDEGTATITITNNVAPTITSSLTWNVAENTTTVGTMTATDPTSDTITWSISGGVDSALFSINSSSGALVFLSAPNYESPGDVGANNVYNITIRATDTGGLYDQENLVITVTDVAEGPEQFGSIHTHLDFSDNTTITNISGTVSSIANKITAVGGNFATATAGLRPALDTSKFSGKQAALFSGDRLNSDLTAAAWQFLADGAGGTVIVAVHMRSGAPGASQSLFGNNSGSDLEIEFLHRTSATYGLQCIVAGTTTSSSNSAWALDTAYVMAIRTKSAAPQVEIFVDGVSKGTGSLGADTGAPTQVLALGQGDAGASASSIWYVAELLIYNEALTDQEVADASDWLATRNNI